MKWDSDLLELFNIPSVDVLPEVKQSADNFTRTKNLTFLPDGIPVTGILGDQQAALFGQAAFNSGDAKCTYGTGAFLLINQGNKNIESKNGLLSTIAWSLGGEVTYAFEGSVFIAGAAIQFLRDQFDMIASADECEALAKDVEAAPELYFVPALSGFGAPDWNAKAKGAFLGLTRGTSKAQIIRASMEGIALQVRDLILAAEQDLNKSITRLSVDGGASQNDLLMQIQANYSNIRIERPKNIETTAFGAAMISGLGSGVYNSLSDITNIMITEKEFKPENLDFSRHLTKWADAKSAVSLFSS